MTQKILCPTDGTDHSDIAVIYAAQLAAKFGIPLSICVVNIAHGGARGPVINHWTDEEMAKKLERAGALARENGVPEVKLVDIISREAAAGIVSYAENNGYDHIILGTGDSAGCRG